MPRPRMHDGRGQKVKRPTWTDPRAAGGGTSERVPFTEKLIGYRTECCLAYNRAVEDGAGPGELPELRREYLWTVNLLSLALITTDWLTMRPRTYVHDHTPEQRRALDELERVLAQSCST